MAGSQVELCGNRTIARVEIGNLVDQWRNLHRLVSGPLSEKCIEDFEEARARFLELSSESAYKLGGIFMGDSIATEFQCLPMPSPVQNQPFLDDREVLAVAALQRAEWLTNLQEDLDRFPESGKITFAGWGGRG
jgi:hypothetical protein